MIFHPKSLSLISKAIFRKINFLKNGLTLNFRFVYNLSACIWRSLTDKRQHLFYSVFKRVMVCYNFISGFGFI
jgi:hypothetical protein